MKITPGHRIFKANGNIDTRTQRPYSSKEQSERKSAVGMKAVKGPVLNGKVPPLVLHPSPPSCLYHQPLPGPKDHRGVRVTGNMPSSYPSLSSYGVKSPHSFKLQHSENL